MVSRQATAPIVAVLNRGQRRMQRPPCRIQARRIAIDRLGGSYGWPSSEIESQLAIETAIKPRSSGGFILWSVGPLLENKKGIALVVAKER